MQRVPRKSNTKVLALSANFYARWRTRPESGPALREDGDAAPPERLLQAVWQHQRLLRDQLQTLDGQPVRVLHPGFKNHEAGPDFRDAMIRIGNGPARAGDVEIDLRASGWRAHGHDQNPAFRNVVLHVLWEGDKPADANLPTLVLRGRLDAPLRELDAWLGPEGLAGLPEALLGKCCAPLRELAPAQLQDLLRQAALVRFQSKAGQFQARARQAGWEQALWEGLFRGLGYKQNAWPMQALAELRANWWSEKMPAPALLARLLGLSGLLPDQLTRSQAATDEYLRAVWDQWWRERDGFGDLVLPRQVWRLSGLRPANHPQRRLALAAHWLAAGDVPDALEKWFLAKLPDARVPGALLEVLQVAGDDFWSWHWTFRSAKLERPQPLLGVTRVTDLAVNVILPWFWARAVEGKNEELQRVAQQRYLHWPAAEDNSLLRLARRRLLAGARAGVLPGAAAQQGLLQIVRDFCEHSNALCEQCEFPRLVRDWSAKTGAAR